MNYIDKLLEHEVYPNEIIKLFYMCPVSAETFEQYSKEQLSEAIKKLIDILNRIYFNSLSKICQLLLYRIII